MMMTVTRSSCVVVKATAVPSRQPKGAAARSAPAAPRAAAHAVEQQQRPAPRVAQEDVRTAEDLASLFGHGAPWSAGERSLLERSLSLPPARQSADVYVRSDHLVPDTPSTPQRAVVRSSKAASAGTIAWPEDLHVISSVAEWAALHASAHRDGALLATVFMSQAALPAYWPGLRSLMRAVGGGVRFAFVEVGAGYYQRVVEAKVPSLAADPADPAGPWAALDVDVALAKLANRRSHTVPGLVVCGGRSVNGACRGFFAERDLPDYHQCVGDLTFLNGLLAGRC